MRSDLFDEDYPDVCKRMGLRWARPRVRETLFNGFVLTQLRDDGSLDHDGGNGDGKRGRI